MSDLDHHATLLDAEARRMQARVGGYEAFHRVRFDYALAKAREVCPSRTAEVLDVGRSYLSLELLQAYDNVTTLGFPLEPHSFTGVVDAAGAERVFKGHIAYDLNAAGSTPPAHTGEGFDLVVFAEVLEHLHTAPELTLHVLKGLMRPGGHLILQTPNAVALHKRWALLAGRNPYERIRVNPLNPGHYREYTKAELIDYAEALGFDVVGHTYRDYFGWTPVPGDPVTRALYKGLVAALPSLARGQTIVLRRR